MDITQSPVYYLDSYVINTEADKEQMTVLDSIQYLALKNLCNDPIYGLTVGPNGGILPGTVFHIVLDNIIFADVRPISYFYPIVILDQSIVEAADMVNHVFLYRSQPKNKMAQKRINKTNSLPLRYSKDRMIPQTEILSRAPFVECNKNLSLRGIQNLPPKPAPGMDVTKRGSTACAREQIAKRPRQSRLSIYDRNTLQSHADQLSTPNEYIDINIRENALIFITNELTNLGFGLTPNDLTYVLTRNNDTINEREAYLLRIIRTIINESEIAYGQQTVRPPAENLPAPPMSLPEQRERLNEYINYLTNNDRIANRTENERMANIDDMVTDIDDNIPNTINRSPTILNPFEPILERERLLVNYIYEILNSITPINERQRVIQMV